MARLRRAPTSTGFRIAVVDDDATLAASLVQLLAEEGHEVRSAATPDEGIELTRSWEPHLMLLDYCMPGGTGADVVRAVRAFDSLVQVLLVTGYAAEQPARRLLAELDIQGYHDKGDGPQRLLILVDAALKHRAVLDRLVRQRGHLRHILEVAPEISRLQPQRELLQTAIASVGRLLDGGPGFIATHNDGLFLFDDACEGVSIHAATGHFHGCASISGLPSDVRSAAMIGLAALEPAYHGSGLVYIPLRTRDGAHGCIVVEAAALPPDSIEPCKLFANQVVQAFENVSLYERATVDGLTTLYNRAFGNQRLDEILRFASRMGDETSVVMIDLDHFKRLNDTYGHSAGDLVLRTVGKLVRSLCRTTDVVARYGGEELFVVLPGTGSNGARIVCDKLRAAISALRIPFDAEVLSVTASIGTAAARAAEVNANALLARADAALYQAKRNGRDRVCVHEDATLELSA